MVKQPKKKVRACSLCALRRGHADGLGAAVADGAARAEAAGAAERARAVEAEPYKRARTHVRNSTLQILIQSHFVPAELLHHSSSSFYPDVTRRPPKRIY
jgi:hypothetical protein